MNKFTAFIYFVAILLALSQVNCGSARRRLKESVKDIVAATHGAKEHHKAKPQKVQGWKRTFTVKTPLRKFPKKIRTALKMIGGKITQVEQGTKDNTKYIFVHAESDKDIHAKNVQK